MGIPFLCTLAKPYRRGGWLPRGFNWLWSAASIFPDSKRFFRISWTLSSSLRTGFLAFFRGFTYFLNWGNSKILLIFSKYVSFFIIQMPTPLSKGTASRLLSFRYFLVNSTFLEHFSFLHFLMYVRVFTFMSVIISSEILFSLQWTNNLSTSANISFGSNLSSTALFGPKESVSITNLGIDNSPHTNTVFSTLNSGRSCSSDRCCNFLLWTDIWSRRALVLAHLVCNTIDGKHFLGTFALRQHRLSSSFSSRVIRSLFAFWISFFSNWTWNSWMLFSSKHPLFGILNFKKFGIISALLQFSKNFTRRSPTSHLHIVFWYCKYSFQQSLLFNSKAKRRGGKNISTTSKYRWNSVKDW